MNLSVSDRPPDRISRLATDREGAPLRNADADDEPPPLMEVKLDVTSGPIPLGSEGNDFH